MDIKTLTKAEKLAILEKFRYIANEVVYTQEEWTWVMNATHSEIRALMQEIQESKDEDSA